MEKKKAKMAKDTLGMEPAVHRKELEKRIAELEKNMHDLMSKAQFSFVFMEDEMKKIKKKIDHLCTRIGIPKL